MEMISDGTLSDGMTRRMERVAAGSLPGHHKLGEAPVGLWEVPSATPAPFSPENARGTENV
jgi:hypothetical protein